MEPTFFSDQTIISVVRVVCVAQAAMRIFKLEEFVAVFARMASA